MWYHKIPVFLWLPALSMIISRSICVVASGIISFFLMFKITLCVCVYIYILEKEMATCSSTLAWKIPWTEEPGRLQSMGSQSRTWLSDFTFTFTYTYIHTYVCVCVFVYTPHIFFKTLKKPFYFILELIQLTMLWYFQVCSEATQPYIFMRSFSPRLPSHPDCHIILSKVPCAMQSVLVSYQFYYYF